MLAESETQSPDLVHAKELMRRSTFGTAMLNAFEENSQHNSKTSRTPEHLKQQKRMEEEEETNKYLDSLLLDNQEPIPDKANKE